MKHATGIMLSLAVASGMTSNVVNVTKSKPTKVTDVEKPAIAVAKRAVVASAATKAAIPSAMAGKRANASSIAVHAVKRMAVATKQATAAVAPMHPAPHPDASTHMSVVASLSAKVKVRQQASEKLLPIGEGAYQSAEAVAQRTLDFNRDCEKHRWNGCFHKDKADIVDGESYGNLRGAESATPTGDPHPQTSGTSAPPAFPTVVPLPINIPDPLKGSAAGYFKGLALTAATLSFSVCRHN
mmetsp:Transcript_133600/g.260151  ORF Transcript_133600/g.260151 Transcript_133600/m.260151 type:complete len:241 (-) Transcript_133600:56-778(-)